jgi:hypothetical protein
MRDEGGWIMRDRASGPAEGRLARRLGRGWRQGFAVACGIVLAAAAAAAASETVEVKPGDSFSQIAARYTGDVRTWRKLYDARKSNLPNPNLIIAGQTLELVTEADGSRYLRASGPPPAHHRHLPPPRRPRRRRPRRPPPPQPPRWRWVSS